MNKYNLFQILLIMASLFLNEYLKSHSFIHDLEDKLADRDVYFDAVLSDIDYPHCPVLLVSPNNKPNSNSLIEARSNAIIVAKHPLIILNELNIDFLQPLLDKILWWKDCTIINLSTGMWSLWRKLNKEFNDLDLMINKFDCYEPIDLENMWNLLKNNKNQYIRILNREMPDAIFDVDELWIIDSSMLETVYSLSLKSYGFCWSDWTLFASGNLFSLVLQTWEILQEYKTEINCFIFQKLNLDRTEDMIASIRNTKKLFLLIDHADSKIVKSYIQNKLSELWLTDISVKYLTPKYIQLTTIFDAYQDEQTNFDPEYLANSIK